MSITVPPPSSLPFVGQASCLPPFAVYSSAISRTVTNSVVSSPALQWNSR